MAFDITKLNCIAAGPQGRVFTYMNSDYAATIAADGYFDTTTEGILRLNDIIFAGASHQAASCYGGVSTFLVVRVLAGSGVSIQGT